MKSNISQLEKCVCKKMTYAEFDLIFKNEFLL